MSRVSMFNSPLLLGFDQFEEVLDRLAKAPADGYPPYNIEQIGDTGLRITLAVAGFGQDDLVVQLENNQLIVSGRLGEDKDRLYLHRGIATRQFKRTFVLAEGIDIIDASLDSGLLNIDLRRPDPKSRVKNIAIRNANSGGGDGTPGRTIEVETDERSAES
ncbi:MAG: Hsp20 family protein [Alphaproteobacteria bacterium]|nr:Hsp20 family protein [Alphaproteobacteria bacterium]